MTFLFRSLESFGFGVSFIKWVKTFYSNITSCVANNGFFTPTFRVKRGVRQGDPLAPSLFIMVLELLSISIRNNVQIKGILVDGNEIKLVTFADDMTSFVRDKQSRQTLLNVIKSFGRLASSLELGTTEIKKSIKILGVHFTYNSLLFYKLNFESIEKSLRDMFKGWGWRGLTLLGKIQIIKSFALPKILYRLTLISNKKEFIKEINTLLYSFVWKGKDKVKRAVLIGPIENGGLKMPDINSMIAAQRIICIKRYLAPNIASWKFFLDFYLKKVGGNFLFHCNFDYSKLSLNLPDFYKECILTWSSLNHNIPSSHAEISNQILWNNKLICINSCSVYNQKIIDTGLLTIRDLINYKCPSNGIWQPLRLLLSPIDHYLLYSLFSALPKEWRRVLKMNDTPSP